MVLPTVYPLLRRTSQPGDWCYRIRYMLAGDKITANGAPERITQRGCGCYDCLPRNCTVYQSNCLAVYFFCLRGSVSILKALGKNLSISSYETRRHIRKKIYCCNKEITQSGQRISFKWCLSHPQVLRDEHGDAMTGNNSRDSL